ncbi:MAG: tRNA pseudouridine(55) synthase TruB [Pirellulaceae bacterium]|nr:tRNA pseudouridine(55) synthase TruB [Pirellulaceae bacterium]
MPLFGVLPINKPAGCSSRVVVDRIQRLVGQERVGHTGTLDPMATGVLLMAVGAATRLVEFSHELDKSYLATFELGKTSDTLDITGEVTVVEGADDHRPTESQILAELSKWQGRVQQVPPNFSALMVDGRRAYKMARKGVEFDLAAREVEILRLELVEYSYPFVKLNIDCGSGTYVRALGRDLAAGLGTAAIMTELTRTRVGPFVLSDCVVARDLYNRVEVARHLFPAQRLVHNWHALTLTDKQALSLRNGAQITFDEALEHSRYAAFDQQGELVALIQANETSDEAQVAFRSIRVFHVEHTAKQPRKIKAKHRPRD